MQITTQSLAHVRSHLGGHARRNVFTFTTCKYACVLYIYIYIYIYILYTQYHHLMYMRARAHRCTRLAERFNVCPGMGGLLCAHACNHALALSCARVRLLVFMHVTFCCVFTQCCGDLSCSCPKLNFQTKNILLKSQDSCSFSLLRGRRDMLLEWRCMVEHTKVGRLRAAIMVHVHVYHLSNFICSC